jgi:hypothetical protein
MGRGWDAVHGAKSVVNSSEAELVVEDSKAESGRVKKRSQQLSRFTENRRISEPFYGLTMFHINAGHPRRVHPLRL